MVVGAGSHDQRSAGSLRIQRQLLLHSDESEAMKSTERSLRAHVYDRLSEMIIAGDVRPGEPLREAKLAEMLGTSRVPVREAIQRLTEEGWLERNPRSSARVIVPSRDYINEVFDLRLILETAAIKLAVRRVSLEDIERLRAISADGDAAAHAGNISDAMRANMRFHAEIAQLTANRLLAETIKGLDRRVRWLYGFIEAERFTEHIEIIQALEDRDVDRAMKATIRHLEHTRKDFLEHWPDPAG